MLKKIINFIKGILLKFIKSHRDIIAELELEVEKKKDKLIKGQDALTNAMAQTKSLEKQLSDLNAKLSSTERNIELSETEDIAKIYAKTLISLRKRKSDIKVSLETTKKTIDNAEEKLMELIDNIEQTKSKIETLKLRKEIVEARKAVNNALGGIKYEQADEEAEKEITFDEFKEDSIEELNCNINPLANKRSEAEIDEILKEFNKK